MAAHQADDRSRSIFYDVFRRADKNDDGALSWEEFKAFFSDGVASDEDLSKLFAEIDTHKTYNLDVGELFEFFTQHLGPFSDVFNSLEGIGNSVTNALMDCHSKYPSSMPTQQFSTRFLLREVARQLGFIQQHLETAIESIEEGEAQDRQESHYVEVAQAIGKKSRQFTRKMKSYQQQTSFPADSSSSIEREVDRLADLIDKLEGKITLDFVEEVTDDSDNEQFVELVCRKFVFDLKKDADIRAFVKLYAENIRANCSCLGLSIYMNSGSGILHLFEIWRSKIELSSHLTSDASRTFQRQLIDCLLQPEDYSKLSVPGSWWKKA